MGTVVLLAALAAAFIALLSFGIAYQDIDWRTFLRNL